MLKWLRKASKVYPVSPYLGIITYSSEKPGYEEIRREEVRLARERSNLYEEYGTMFDADGNKFREGDLLRYDGPSNEALYSGNWYEVIRTERSSVLLKTSMGAWVVSRDQVRIGSELEKLVNRVNDGQKAFKILNNKYGDRLEIRGTGSKTYCKEWIEYQPIDSSYELRVRAPKFDGFITSCFNRWPVELALGVLHIGCQTFNAKAVKSVLQEFETGLCTQAAYTATIAGIKETCSGRVLSWQDCDKLLKELRKAGI